MTTIYFVTGNNNKFEEAVALIPSLKRYDKDLPEIQSLDPQIVIAEKLKAARNFTDQPLIVEDTSLYLEGLNGFPGPLIKWMLHAVGNQGIYELTQSINNKNAVAKTIIGYSNQNNEILYFEGTLDGLIVPPSGNEGFGWDAIFKPDGLHETFAEMGDDYKPEFSMRSQAFHKTKDYFGK